MALIKKQTKKFYKRLAFFSGLSALFILKIFLGQGGGDISELSQKADGILNGSAGSIPTAHADFWGGVFGGGCDDGGGGGDGCAGGCDSGGDGGDGGCSLVVEYWNGVSFVPLDIYLPRYYQPTLNTITVPTHAIQPSGEVHLRVTATKRHKVYFAGLIAPKKHISSRTERFSVEKAFHKREGKDYTEILNKPRSGEYLHTIPGDVVDITFEVGESKILKSEQESYVLRAGGVYTAVSREARQEAGDWVSRLDPESRAFLENLYALNTYYDSERKQILSNNL